VTALYAYTRLEERVIYEDLKKFVYQQAEKVLGVDIMAESLTGGILGNIIIGDFRVFRTSPDKPIVSIEKVIIEYNLLDRLKIFALKPKSLLLLWRADSAQRIDMLIGEEGIGKIYLISPKIYAERIEFDTGEKTDGGKAPEEPAVTYSKPLKFIIAGGEILPEEGSDPILYDLFGKVSLQGDNIVFDNIQGGLFGNRLSVNGTVTGLSDMPRLDLGLKVKGDHLNIRSVCEGPLNGFTSEGVVDAFGKKTVFTTDINIPGEKDLIHIDGLSLGGDFTVDAQINYARQSGLFYMKPPKGEIKGEFNFSNSRVAVEGMLNHVDFFSKDLISDIKIVAEAKKQRDVYALKSDIRFENIILDYKPFTDVRMIFFSRASVLDVLSLEIGEGIRFHGKIITEPPYDVDVSLSVNNIDLSTAFRSEGMPVNNELKGIMNGGLSMKGPFETAESEGRFEVRDGKIGDLVYSYAVVNLKGSGPHLWLEDSKIFKDVGFLLMSGEINLKEIGKKNVMEDIIIETDQKVVIWEGWEVLKPDDSHMVSATKKVSDDINLNFKTFMEPETLDDSEKTSEVELEYKLKTSDSLKMKFKDQEEFFGVERKIKF
jgi:hypothetical protein